MLFEFSIKDRGSTPRTSTNLMSLQTAPKGAVFFCPYVFISMENFISLLSEIREQLIEMYKVADDSIADYILDIQTAVNFVDKALKTQDRLDVFKALQKSFDVLEKEYDETPPDEEYDDLVDRIRNIMSGLNENTMKDYIKEFGDDQEKRNVKVNWQPQTPDTQKLPYPEQPENDTTSFTAEEGYEARPITYLDPKTKKLRAAQWISKTPPNPPIPKPDSKGQTGFPAESITENELKKMVSSAVLHMMNAPTPEDYSLLESQKQEITDRINEYWDRPGVMSICFHENAEKDEACVGMLIDPTNTQNWVFLKEEIVYKLPYAYKEALHSFASGVWKNKNLVMEAGLPDTGQVQLLKTQIAAAHKEADARYHEVAHQSNGYTLGNPFEPTRQNFPNPQEGHRNALADGQYRALKKRAIDLEVQLRRLEKTLKKSNS